MSKHYIITNRPVRVKNGQEQIDESNQAATTYNLRFGTAEIVKGRDGKPKAKVEIIPDVPLHNNKFKELTYKNLEATENLPGSAQWFKSLYDEMGTKRKSGNDTLFFIHGFNCGYECLIKSLIDLDRIFVKDRSNPIARIVAFSWPSNDMLTEYRKDQADAGYAGIALARGYHKLLKFFSEYLSDPDKHCKNNIHVLCHSMGNQVFERMVKEIISSHIPAAPIFKQVVLAAPDIDNDALEPNKPLHHITDFCDRVHIYFHKSDDALKISNLTKNKTNRLGLTGPTRPLELRMNVNVVEASKIKDAQGIEEKLIDHWYYVNSETVAHDIRQVFSGIHTELIKGREYLQHKNIFRLTGKAR
ncbi:MAG: alpha/beta hydrolase [Cyclobacteriaceae bacterium]|nr:alpha/beta hydrolase [Cyclobacteriaceae bacterium]